MNKNKQQIIGSRVVVDFPEAGIIQVPAKVDTGADSSSVWASNIKQDKEGLSFNLFSPSSNFYTGKVMRVTEYETRSVKNSFGVSEVRYKVPITIKLRGRTIKARFTLSNRENSRFPVLVGRQTLKGKFVVDVAHAYGVTEPLRILVLAHRGNKKSVNQFSELVENNKDKLSVDVIRYQDLMMIADSEDVRLSVQSIQRDVASYDFIYFLTRTRNADLASMVAAYARRRAVNFADRAAIMMPTNTKMHQAMLLAAREVSIPRTIYMHQSKWRGSYKDIVETLGKPFILKDNHGRKGRNNFLIKNKKDFESGLEVVENEDLQMVAQQFIPNDGYYRLVVIGDKVVLAMYRKIDHKHSHLPKKSISGPAKKVELIDLPDEARQLAATSAKLLSLDIAGVDIIKDKKSGSWYCLEVNNSPQLVGGAFVDEKMRELGKYFKKEAKR